MYGINTTAPRLRVVGGRQIDVKMIDRIAHSLIYAGVIKGKWTNDKPVKAQFDGIVSTELFNRANHGKLSIEIDSNKEVTLHHKQPPEWQLVKQSINPDFPFKKVVSCPDCRNR